MELTLAARLRTLLPQRADWTAVRRAPRRDVLAGVTVAIVAMPLALAFGVSSGLGAQAGLVSAVVAGVVAAVFGGSNLQVSGPTGAMTVVLVPVVDRFGVRGVLMAGAMAGVVLIAMALARVGRYVRYLPLPVVEGFTAGIAVVIAMQQLPNALGVDPTSGGTVWQVALDAAGRFASHPDAAPLAVALAVAGTMLVGARVRPGLPFSLIAVAGATVLTPLLGLHVALLGAIPAGIPSPSLAFLDPAAFRALLPSALAIAALAALESLLSATVADGMSVGERHDPDRELFGQGLANLAAPLCGGLPATAAIARTAVNVRAGASSKLAAVMHALVLAAIAFSAGPLVAQIPLAALAGVLLATTVRMVDPTTLRALARATRGDAAVLMLTFTVTIAVDLVAAVAVGVGVAVVLALRAIARTATFEQVPLDPGDHTAEEHALLSEHIVAYRPEGPLFFAAANHFLTELTNVADVHTVILRMSHISTMDATGALILGNAITHLERRGIVVLISGITAEHHDLLTVLDVARTLRDEGRVFADTPAAIDYARASLRAVPRARDRASSALAERRLAHL
jgi:sulfate permease, SulP family